MTTSTLPRIGDLIRLTFRDTDGDLNTQYIGTVTHADRYGVDLADAQVYDSTMAAEFGPEAAHWTMAEVGVAWGSSIVHVYKPHAADCICSCCHDYS